MLPWKNNNYHIFWVCVPCLCYPALNGHPPYYVFIFGLSGFTIFFPHYLIKDTIFWEKLFDTNNTIFWEKLFDIKCVFLFCLEVLSEAFLILRRNERDIIIKVLRSSCKVPLLFLFDFVLNLNFLNKKYKIYKIKIYE